MRWIVGLVILSLVTESSQLFAAIDVVVPGTAAIWLAGQPNGTSEIYNDSAPQNSPVSVNLAGFTGNFVSFSVTGLTSIDPNLSLYPLVGPDGATLAEWPTNNSATIYANTRLFSLSGLAAPACSLVGVFIDSAQTYATPANLDFSSPSSQSFAELSPELQQVFFIGDGLTGTGEGDVQSFQIPAGADTLCLATFDDGNYNNPGSFQVNISSSVPEPSSLVAWSSLGVMGLVGYGWQKRKL